MVQMSWYAERKYLIKDIAGIEEVIQCCSIKQVLLESQKNPGKYSERVKVKVFVTACKI